MDYLPIQYQVGGSDRLLFRQFVVALVDELLNTKPISTEGLCAHVTRSLKNTTNYATGRLKTTAFATEQAVRFYIRNVCMRSWPCYSGDTKYPVPSINPAASTADMYQTTINLWDSRTQYGRLRMDLRDYVCEQLLALVADK